MIELATFLAVSIFNDGFYAILKMLQVMDVIIGPIAGNISKLQIQE